MDLFKLKYFNYLTKKMENMLRLLVHFSQKDFVRLSFSRVFYVHRCIVHGFLEAKEAKLKSATAKKKLENCESLIVCNALNLNYQPLTASIE